ncbi:MAG: hypothetical protein E4G99_10545, partial [Anaerolineales bacterium]
MNRLLALWEPMRLRMRQLFENLGETYRRLNRSSGGTLAIVALTIRRFGQTRASENAAVLAYYTLFSIFPFFLSLIVAGSFFLERGEVQQHVQDFIVQAFPASQSLIEENLSTVLTLRGTVGAVGLLGLSWSATGLFTNLIFAINRAWPNTRPRNFLRKRLAGLGVALSLAFLLGLSVLTTTAVDLLLSVDLSKLGLAALDFLPMQSLLTRALA